MYLKPWVQKLIQQIRQSLQAQTEADWVDIDRRKPQRVLDYACGNGTVSGVSIEPDPAGPKVSLIKRDPGAPRVLPQRHLSRSRHCNLTSQALQRRSRSPLHN